MSKPTQEAQLGAKILISGEFECRDSNGVLLKTISLSAVAPLVDILGDDAKVETQQPTSLGGSNP